MANFIWKKTPGQYAYGSTCTVADYVFGTTNQPMQSKNYVGPRWKAIINLPGIRLRDGLLFETEEEAKACLERVATKWIKLVNES